MSFDAVVLAGGRGSRLGGVVKADVEVGGRALLDHVVAGLSGAAAVVVVGPPAVTRPGVDRVLEDPPGGGPVAGLAAGLARLGTSGAPTVVVLACDIPRGTAAIPALLAAAEGADGARLLSGDHPQHLAAVYRRAALDAAFARLGDPAGVSMRTLLEGLDLVDVPDPDDLGADADTWSDVRRLDATLRGTIEP